MTYKYRTAVANVKRNENLRNFRFFLVFQRLLLRKEDMPKGIITNMIKAYIRINDLNDINTLHEAALSCKYDLVVQSGTKILNPKSLMGIFGLGTKKTVSLVAKYDDKRDFLEKFGDLIST